MPLATRPNCGRHLPGAISAGARLDAIPEQPYFIFAAVRSVLRRQRRIAPSLSRRDGMRGRNCEQSSKVHPAFTELFSSGLSLITPFNPPKKWRPNFMKKVTTLVFALAVLTASGLIAGSVFAQTATVPYKLTVFATAPKGLSAPDSIAVLDGHVFVGYGDGHLPDGSDGLSNQIVEYRMDGSVVRTYSVVGHNDGLKVDPVTHLLWVLQNEDANANLVIINTETQHQKLYTFGPTLHGGGYDDMVFRGCKVYISASNPKNNPNTGPALVSARLEGNLVEVVPVLAGEASAIDIPTDATVQLNLLDPDSMTLDPL